MDSDTFDKIKATMRFEGKSSVELALKTSEETGELAEAVLSSNNVHGNSYKMKTVDDVIEEGVDVIICSVATMLRMQPDLRHSELVEVMERKITKWREKVGALGE